MCRASHRARHSAFHMPLALQRAPRTMQDLERVTSMSATRCAYESRAASRVVLSLSHAHSHRIILIDTNPNTNANTNTKNNT